MGWSLLNRYPVGHGMVAWIGFVLAAWGGCAEAADAQMVELVSPYPAKTVHRGDLEVTLGEIRVVMRGPMFPSLARVGPDSLIVTAHRAEEGGPVTSIRSDDLGATWRPFTPGVPRGAGMNTLLLSDGRVVALMYDTAPLPDRPGLRSTLRWESDDQWRTIRGPLADGTLFLPPDEFKAANHQWFHGNTIEMPDGSLLAVMQGIDKHGSGIYPFHVFASQSTDGGKTWTFLSRIASLDNIHDPEGLTKKGWRLHGPCEPCVVRLGERRLMCVARLINDDADAIIAPATETYRDLSYTVSGDGIHPGTLIPADRFVTPAARSAPLVAAFSSDNGCSWTQPEPMREACGCFPRMAASEGVVALTYGGLGYPRWGNCISFSTDGGKTWTKEINFAPFLTTGYTDILPIGPRRFLCVFDCTPPQPWTAHTAHWVGVLDVEVRIEK